MHYVYYFVYEFKIKVLNGKVNIRLNSISIWLWAEYADVKVSSVLHFCFHKAAWFYF